MHTEIENLVQALQISNSSDATYSASWYSDAQVTLISLHKLAQSTRDLPPELVVLIAAHVAPFHASAPWTNDTLQQQADVVLDSLDITREILRQILDRHVKHSFVPSPHPMLDLDTGRKLPRPAGGAMAMQDYYETQIWKTRTGLAELLVWVLSKLQPEDYEVLWPLLIPPIMTYIDDYQAKYKLEGVKLVKEMLRSVPSTLLSRSGVGELLYTSLSRTLAALHDPVSPSLIRLSVPTAVTLITLIEPAHSPARFDKLCHILGEGIIGGVWVYATRDLETVQASVETCEVLQRALGVGSIRFTKALIPQFTHCLVQHEVELDAKPVSFQLAALKALLTTIEVCQIRMHRWKGRIVEGVGKVWVIMVDNKEKYNGEQWNALEKAVTEVFIALARYCPSASTEEYKRLREFPELFEKVLPVADA